MIQSKKSSVPSSLHAARFDLAAASVFSDFSRKQIKTIIDRGGAYHNGRRVLIAKTPVKTGDTMELVVDLKEHLTGEAAPNSPQVLFRGGALTHEHIVALEEDFILLNKPAGLASQATLTQNHTHVLTALTKLDPETFAPDKLFLVHRLDQDTSGLMIVARNKEAGLTFENLFKERKIQKFYRALCFGKPKDARGTINFAIGKDAKHPNKYRAIFQNLDAQRPNQRSSKSQQNKKNTTEKSAVTNYVLLQAWNRGVCEIQCSPLTGRTHQVRVHLSAIGCPLLGDKTYAHNLPGHGAYKMALRHMLHAWKLEFKYKGRTYSFEAPLAKDYQDILNTLK